MARSIADEKFSITFAGTAFDGQEISAAALAQSLLALDALARGAGALLFGKETKVDVKVYGTPRLGSFIIDLQVEHPAKTVSGKTILDLLMDVLGLAKWARGKQVEKIYDNASGSITIRNETGAENAFNAAPINFYMRPATEIALSRMTQTLDLEGVESITLASSSGIEEIITREDRAFFHREAGVVLSDNKVTVVLKIIGAKLNGSPNGWTFSAGQGDHEFMARVEDKKFLQGVKANRIILKNGTTIVAIVRTLQKKLRKLVEEKSVVEVIEINQPD